MVDKANFFKNIELVQLAIIYSSVTLKHCQHNITNALDLTEKVMMRNPLSYGLLNFGIPSSRTHFTSPEMKTKVVYLLEQFTSLQIVVALNAWQLSAEVQKLKLLRSDWQILTH